MKFFIVALVLVAGVCADVSELGYNYPQPAHSAPVQQSFAPVSVPEQSYIPPAPAPAPVHHAVASAPIHHHAPAPAPVHHHAPAPAPVFHQPAPAPAPVDDGYSYSQPQADQGYRYKTVRRVVYRYRH